MKRNIAHIIYYIPIFKTTFMEEHTVVSKVAVPACHLARLESESLKCFKSNPNILSTFLKFRSRKSSKTSTFLSMSAKKHLSNFETLLIYLIRRVIGVTSEWCCYDLTFWTKINTLERFGPIFRACWNIFPEPVELLYMLRFLVHKRDILGTFL